MLLSTVLAAIISPTLSVLLTLVIGPSRVSRVAKPLSLMATGLLITLALTHLLPEAMEKAPNSHDVGLYALITVLLLIAFEMFFSIHHHHDGACKNNKHHQEVFSSGGAGLISGTALHTFCDGILIAGSFMLGNGVGIAVTLVIAIIVLAAIFVPKLLSGTGSELECPNFVGKTLEVLVESFLSKKMKELRENFGRGIYSSTFSCKMDAQRRILLPSSLVKENNVSLES